MFDGLHRVAMGATLSLAMVWPSIGIADPITVWLEGEPPEARFTERADRLTGGTSHLDAVDLRFPPGPLSERDEASINRVLGAVKTGLARWDEFEVELAIARDIQLALDHVTIVPNERDRQALFEALLFQGAAAVRAFEPEDFLTHDDAAQFRVDFDGTVLPKPWVDAYAVLGEGEFTRQMIVDGTAWVDLQRYKEAIEGLAPATIGVDTSIGQLWVDGQPAPAGETSVELRPGRHWLHVVYNGEIRGRQIVDLKPGETIAMPSAVPMDDVDVASARVMLGSRAGFPDSVTASLEDLEKFHGGPVFVGAIENGRSLVVPWSSSASLDDDRLVTVVLGAEIGGGAMLSPLFEQNEEGGLFAAGAVHASAGLELGISYFILSAGVDVGITPGRTMAFANNAETKNISTAVFPQPWAGLGFYALRPTAKRATFQVIGTVGWNAPSHLAYGGKLTVGVPIDNRVRWFRITAGANYGPQTLWKLDDDPQEMITAYLRIGLGSRL